MKEVPLRAEGAVNPGSQDAVLCAERLSLGYGRKRVTHDVDLAVRRGEILTIIGPNGSGKSTLLKALARLIEPQAGRVTLDGRDIWSLTERTVARRIAFLPQSADLPPDLTVLDIVRMGRLPHQGFFSPLCTEDDAACRRALCHARVETLADRPLRSLSGGERQRARLAMALAQEPEILLLDEPTTYLDIRYQLELMALVEELNDALSLTILMVLHDLHQAVRYSDRLVAVKDGRVEATGAVDDVFDEALVERLYGVRSRMEQCVFGGRSAKICLPQSVV